MLALLVSACSGDGGSRPSAVACDVYVRESERARFRHERVTLRFPSDESVVDRENGSVRLLLSTEQGTAGSLAVIVLGDEDEELARGLYQLADTLVDQFSGRHGFTGLVVWRDPRAGDEVQFHCAVA